MLDGGDRARLVVAGVVAADTDRSTVVYGTLYRRIPGLRLAVDLEQVPFKPDAGVYGVYELPVTW